MKPNVLLFIDSFAQGGTERQVVQLARLLAESGRYQIHLACLKREGVLRAEAESAGFTDIPEFSLTSFYNRNMLAQLRRAAAYLREHSIDIVETHDFYTNVFGMSAAALARTPVRIASRRETGGLKTPAQVWVERRAFNLADAVIANAEAVRRELIRQGIGEEKISTVYNGMDTARVAPRPGLRRDDALALLGLPPDGDDGDDAPRRFVPMVANMWHPSKDQATFLRAAQLVHAAVPEAAFVLAGEGALQESLRSLAAELGLASRTFFTGRCAHVPELLAVSEACVLSSGAEGFSNSIIEYMAAARPVVATDVGGAREQIVEGETGHIVAPGDHRALAERLISLLRDPARARGMGERGLEVVKGKFSCGAQVERVENLYERLLARKKSSVPRTGLEAEARR